MGGQRWLQGRGEPATFENGEIARNSSLEKPEGAAVLGSRAFLVITPAEGKQLPSKETGANICNKGLISKLDKELAQLDTRPHKRAPLKDGRDPNSFQNC